MDKRPDLCIILPIKDEQESIVSLLEDITASLKSCPDLSNTILIAVDDHSTDDGITMLRAWCEEQQHLALEVLRLDSTHGLYMALLRGCKHADKFAPHYTIILDADGQDDPSYIPKLLEVAAVSEIVFAARGHRKDSLYFQICYRLFQLLMRLFSGKKFEVSHYVVLQRHVLSAIAKLDYIDFFGAALHFSNFSRQEIIADRRDRIAGKSKFRFMQRLLLAISVFSHSKTAVTTICGLAIGVTLICCVLTLVSNSRLWALLTLLSSAAALAILMLFVTNYQKRNQTLG